MSSTSSRPLPPMLDVILLAGSRPGADPLAQAAGVPTKSLVQVAGRPMIDHVARTLADHPRIGSIHILAQQGADVLAATPETSWLATDPHIHFLASRSGISQSLLDILETGQADLPLLVTTADNVLLDAAIIDSFLAGIAPGADLAVAMVERRAVLARFPDARRTWLKFRDGWWSGANLFWLGTPRARAALELWRGIEQDRKKGWRIISAFGPLLLVGAALRLLTLRGALRGAGRRLGLSAQLVPLPQAHACIDADKPEDIELIEEILPSPRR